MRSPYDGEKFRQSSGVRVLVTMCVINGAEQHGESRLELLSVKRRKSIKVSSILEYSFIIQNNITSCDVISAVAIT